MKSCAPEDLSDLLYTLHGRFLNLLGHLHGEDPREWPPLPPAPTFLSKHAPYISFKAPTKTYGKGKGKAVEVASEPPRAATPLFLPGSPSPQPPYDFGGATSSLPSDPVDVSDEGETSAS